MRSLTLVGLLAAILVLAACDGEVGSGITTSEGGDRTTTTRAPDTTTTGAPDTTTTRAPDTTTSGGSATTTTAAGAEEDDSNAALFIVIGTILVVVVIIAVNASRRSKEAAAAASGATAAAAAAPAWKPTADQAYSQSRWLYEHLTAELGQWRGDQLHAAGAGGEAAAGDPASSNQQVWDQLGTQMSAATTTLYQLESQVPAASQPVVRSVVDGLNQTRTAVDQVASARQSVDQANDAYQGDSGNQDLQQALSTAQANEQQAVQQLNGSRTVLQGALANLAALR